MDTANSSGPAYPDGGGAPVEYDLLSLGEQSGRDQRGEAVGCAARRQAAAGSPVSPGLRESQSGLAAAIGPVGVAHCASLRAASAS